MKDGDSTATDTSTTTTQGLRDPLSQQVQLRRAKPCPLVPLSLNRSEQVKSGSLDSQTERRVGRLAGRAQGYGDIVSQREGPRVTVS